MKNLFTLLLVVACSIAVHAQQKAVPSVSLKTLDGKTVNLQDFKKDGKVTVISVWATWCKPCHKELDAIAEIYPDWQEELDVEVVAVTIDSQRALAKVPSLVETHAWEYTILSDTKQALREALNFQTIPQTFVIDTKGQIAYTHSGYVPGYEYDLEDEIKKLLAKK